MPYSTGMNIAQQALAESSVALAHAREALETTRTYLRAVEARRIRRESGLPTAPAPRTEVTYEEYSNLVSVRDGYARDEAARADVDRAAETVRP